MKLPRTLRRHLTHSAAAVALVASLAACGSAGGGATAADTSTDTKATTVSSSTTSTAPSGDAGATVAEVLDANAVPHTAAAEWDAAAEKVIDLSKQSGTVTI